LLHPEPLRLNLLKNAKNGDGPFVNSRKINIQALGSRKITNEVHALVIIAIQFHKSLREIETDYLKCNFETLRLKSFYKGDTNVAWTDDYDKLLDESLAKPDKFVEEELRNIYGANDVLKRMLLRKLMKPKAK